MTLSLFDSATKTQREFVPVTPGKAGIYLCGATVQGAPHIGHLRSGLAFDVLTRWLQRSGYEVTMVRNVTDIDDKILAEAKKNGKDWWAWAYRFENEFAKAYDALGVLRPTYEPRATGHMTDMFNLMAELIDAGHAYVGNPGNVYFDVQSLPDYGSLTHQSIENMTVDEATESDKRNPHDFALWKAPKEGEPETAAWDSPWGRGRPGWHLECSAMAGRYLGDEFDIHGGGLDLRFPHHENEQAQSHGAGRGFARTWMHNGWVRIAGEKMSKSLGNSLTVENILTTVPAPVLRFALVTAHYRSMVDFSETTIAEAESNWERISGFLDRAAALVSLDDDAVAGMSAEDFPEKFRAALDDDLNVSAGMAVIHDHVTAGNKAIAAKDLAQIEKIATDIRAMMDVMGLDPMSAQWAQTNDSKYEDALDSLVKNIIAERAEARAAKDWARADSLRDTLAVAGITVEDGADGATWHVKEKA